MRRSLTARRGGLLLLVALSLGLLAAGCGDDGGPTTEPPDATTSTPTPQSAPTESLQQATEATGPAPDEGTTAGDAATTADTPTTMDTAATDDSTDAPPETTATDATESTGTGDSTVAAGDAAPIMLVVEDLPSGYGEKPYASENADCLGPALDGSAAEVHPPNAFAAESVVGEARSRAWSFATAEEAEAAFAAATGDEVQACILAGAEKDLQTDDYEPGGMAETRPLELDAVAGADEQASTTYAAVFTPAGDDRQLTAYSNIIVVRAGDTVAAYQFLTLEQPFSPADQQKAIAAAVARHASSA